MSMIVPQNTEEQSNLEVFAELHWLDTWISFIFRLLAKLAEPFLAFGLIASAIDYGSHGHLLESNAFLMMVWISTQALALEGSGGVALAMSFEAQAQQDQAKAWTQRCLGLALMLVGGVMFFSEMSVAAPGFKEVMASPFYVYGMGALRTLVSLWYIAVCRTKDHRYSGTAQPLLTAQSSAHQTEALRSDLEETAHQIDDVRSEVEEAAHQNEEMRNDLTELRSLIQGQIAEVRTVLQSQLSELPSLVQAAAQSAVASMEYEIDPAQFVAQIEESIDQAMMRTAHSMQAELAQVVSGLRTDLTAHVAHTVDQAVMRTAQSPRTTDELAQSLRTAHHSLGDEGIAHAHSKETVKIPAVSETGTAQLRIQQFITVQRAQDHEPTIAQIMEATGCAKNTAVKYRKEMEVAQ